MAVELHGAFTTEFSQHRQKRKRLDPKLLTAVLDTIPIGSRIIDVGAGTGELVAALREHGYTARGVDGTPGIQSLTDGLVIQVDLAKSVHWPELFRDADKTQWATCLEVGEHLPREHELQFWFNLSNVATQGLMLSWARIGQRGRGHINCHQTYLVANRLGAHGWLVDESATEKAREIAGKGWDRKLLVCRKHLT